MDFLYIVFFSPSLDLNHHCPFSNWLMFPSPHVAPWLYAFFFFFFFFKFFFFFYLFVNE